ncbi:MAG: ABC transporter permease [Pseudanabaenaceae cyanobacterium bins.68]|nr:ABC transporter permease [Pseudanabaenaceae cyanobacterium bins.68]
MSFYRIFSVAQNVFRETLREQVLYLVLLFGFVLIATGALVPMFTYDSANKLISDLGLAAIEVVGLIVAAFVGTSLINKEIDKRTIFVLVAKPISRGELILGKHLGISGILALLTLVMTGLFVGYMGLRGVALPMAAVLTASLFIFAKLVLVAAIAILFGSFTSALLATLLTFVSYLFGNFTEDLKALGALAKDENVQRITDTLYLLLPNLARADLKNQAIYGVLPDLAELVNNGVYIFAYSLLLLAIAILIFARREF